MSETGKDPVLRSTRTGRAAILLGAACIGMALAWQPTPREVYTASEIVLPCPRGMTAAWGGSGWASGRECITVRTSASLDGSAVLMAPPRPPFVRWFCWDQEDSTMMWGEDGDTLGFFSGLTNVPPTACDSTLVVEPSLDSLIERWSAIMSPYEWEDTIR